MIQVNTGSVSEEQILQEMSHHPADSREEAMAKASEFLVIRELIRQRAQDLGITSDQPEGQENSYPDDAHLDKLLELEVEMPKASEDDCRHYFEQNPRRFKSSPILAVRHILLAANPDDEGASMEAEDQARELIAQLKVNPDSFTTLAQRYSACPSKDLGGELGQISRGQTVPELEKQLLRCRPGLVEVPLASRYGVHVVMVDQYIEGQALDYSMVAERIAEYLNEKVKRKATAQYVQYLISQATIEGFDFSVSKSPLFQ